MIKGKMKKGEYFDSVSLMLVGKELTAFERMDDAAVMMGTQENKAILKSVNLFCPEFEQADDSTLMFVVKSESEEVAENALKQVDEILKQVNKKHKKNADFSPKTLDRAIQENSGLNFALISIAGKYAAKEARKALENGLYVMLFSDNVSLEDEIQLKELALQKDLLLMGPDCGTAIINGVPLGFANAVPRGNIGIVAAAGTGLQEVSSLLANHGLGISQAIGTGGRDVKEAVGGKMFLKAMQMLADDDETEVLVLVSKPPAETVLEKIAAEIKEIKKPLIAVFLGAEQEAIESSGAIPAKTLTEAVEKTLLHFHKKPIWQNLDFTELLKIEASKKTAKQQYIRALFSGGTLCDEAMLILAEKISEIYSNRPLKPEQKIEDVWQSQKHTLLDLGEDEFTVGRPHPMLDFSLRLRRFKEEAKEPETAVILFDLVLGYGTHANPLEELLPVIEEISKQRSDISFVCSVTGTDDDPQNRNEMIEKLKKENVIVLPSNALAVKFCAKLIGKMGMGKK
jgi:succinyl-CoA synthetase alpha subunit